MGQNWMILLFGTSLLTGCVSGRQPLDRLQYSPYPIGWFSVSFYQCTVPDCIRLTPITTLPFKAQSWRPTAMIAWARIPVSLNHMVFIAHKIIAILLYWKETFETDGQFWLWRELAFLQTQKYSSFPKSIQMFLFVSLVTKNHSNFHKLRIKYIHKQSIWHH